MHKMNYEQFVIEIFEKTLYEIGDPFKIQYEDEQDPLKQDFPANPNKPNPFLRENKVQK